LEDEAGNIWYLSIVGGPAVGSIELNEAIVPGAEAEILDKIAAFYFGGTCCMVAPVAANYHPEYSEVWVGLEY